MSPALKTRNSQDYIAAFAYAQAMKDSGTSKIEPDWFALSYESAKASWAKSPGTRKSYKPIQVFFREFERNHRDEAA